VLELNEPPLEKSTPATGAASALTARAKRHPKTRLLPGDLRNEIIIKDGD
jgi:hypothetical protein